MLCLLGHQALEEERMLYFPDEYKIDYLNHQSVKHPKQYERHDCNRTTKENRVNYFTRLFRSIQFDTPLCNYSLSCAIYGDDNFYFYIIIFTFVLYAFGGFCVSCLMGYGHCLLVHELNQYQ